MATKVLHVIEQTIGKENPGYAAGLNNLGMLYISIGEYTKAEPLLVQGGDIRKKTLGEGHPVYAESLNNLGLLYYTKGEYAKYPFTVSE